MNKVLTRLAGAALVFAIMLGVNMYTPIIGEDYDFSTRDVNVVDAAVDNSGYFISWISGSAEKVAYADTEIQEISEQSTYDKILQSLYFLQYTYNIPVTDMVTGDVYPYNVFDDTTGVFHNWTISDAQGQRQTFFNFIKGLTGGIIDWNVMQTAYDAVQLDFIVGTYRAIYNYGDDITGLISDNTLGIDELNDKIQDYVTPALQSINSRAQAINTSIGNVYDLISQLNTNAGLMVSRLGAIQQNTADIEEYLDDINTGISGVDDRLLTANNSLNVLKSYNSNITKIYNLLNNNINSLMPYNYGTNLTNLLNKLEAIRAYLVTIPAIDYTQRLTQILNAIQGQTISVDDKGIVSAINDMHDDVVDVLEEISDRIKTIGGDIVSAIQDQQVNVTVPSGSIANVADYSYKLDNIISLLEDLLQVAYDFNPANDYMNGFYPDIANYLMETVIPNIDQELQGKMPFGIPALVSSCIQVFRNAQPVAPSATVPIPDGQGNSVSLTLSLAQWSGIQHVTYFISVLMFVLALAMATKKLVFWNGG